MLNLPNTLFIVSAVQYLYTCKLYKICTPTIIRDMDIYQPEGENVFDMADNNISTNNLVMMLHLASTNCKLPKCYLINLSAISVHWILQVFTHILSVNYESELIIFLGLLVCKFVSEANTNQPCSAGKIQVAFVVYFVFPDQYHILYQCLKYELPYKWTSWGGKGLKNPGIILAFWTLQHFFF